MRLFHLNKNDWLSLNEPFFSDHPEQKFRFIFPAVKCNVNRISFMVGSKFHFGSRENTLLDRMV